MEVNGFGISYGYPKKRNPQRQPSYFGSYLFSSYLPIYKNFSLSPILGIEYYYLKDRGDRIFNRELFYGIGLEKRFKINSHADFGLALQKIYNQEKYESSNSINRPISKSDLFRLKASINTMVYKNIGLNTSVNYVAHDTDKTTNILGNYREFNFSFGFVYRLGGGLK